jgi:adenosylcobinamide-GDP ribazoletransferase
MQIKINLPSYSAGSAQLLGRRFLLAVQFLTRIPTPQVATLDPADLSRSAIFFPVVGLIIGLAVAAAAALGAMINAPVAGLLGLVVWAAITGGLHLDGLGDVADALGAAHRDPERFHEVLRDPHAGSFAVIAIALQIVAKLVLIISVAAVGGVWAIVLIPAWARWGAMFWANAVPPLREGTGERFSWEIGLHSIAGWGLALALVSAWMAPMLLAALVVVPGIAAFWRWRLRGITGDCLGASIEVTESLLLLALLIRAG